MKKLLILASMVLVYSLPVSAQTQVWQKPVVKKCDLAPGAQCNIEVTCPDSHPIVISGGGGIPKAMPESNQVALTMNLPIASDKWRVRWKNLSSMDKANVKAVAKVLCATK